MRCIAIDIGGTKTAIGSVNRQWQIIEELQFPTRPADGFQAFVIQLNSRIEKLLSDTKTSIDDYQAIGIGCPGPLNIKAGIIENPYTLPSWQGQNIVTTIANQWQRPVVLENDADCALLGELHSGAGREFQNIVMLTLGTGVGGAVTVGGQIYRGARNEHPELGHVPVSMDGPECYCGQRGCLESLASGAALENAARELEIPSSHELFRLAQAGHTMAQNAIQMAIAAVEQATWILLHTFVPDLIVLGGGIADEHFELFSNPMTRSIQQAKQGLCRVPVKVVKAELGNRAGLVGAASIAFQSTNSGV